MTTNGKKVSKDGPLSLDDVQKLVTMLDKSGLHELEVEMGGAKVRLAKPGPAPVAQAHTPVLYAPPAAAPAATAGPAPAAAVPAAAPAGPPPAPARSATSVEVKSPMVGTFYRAPSPTAEPFVKIGDRVRKGQVVCIIEAMKLMNEIEAESDGVVTDIVVENAQPVEYGEALMHLETAS